MIRSQYAYYWLGKLRHGGEVVDITEDEYKKIPHIFEPPGYIEELAKKNEVVEKVAEPEEEKIVEEGIIGNRAILKKPTRKRQG
jgi:hypothetical protein